MLTVRWNEPNNVCTTMEANRVSSQPQVDEDGVDRGRRHIFVERPDGSVFCIDKGTIFVMNEAGKTVSSHYDIEGSAPPISKAA